MNESHAAITDVELDRLIDGELPLAEQRRVLARLEAEPDGWRRLALGFLEDQALRQVCPGLLSDGPAWPAETASAPQSTLTSRTPRIWAAIALAVAASFLLGMWVNRSNTLPERTPTNAMTAANSAATPRPAVDRLRVVFPEDSGEWSEPVELPVVDRSDARAQLWLTEQPVWPQALRNSLREAGQQVSEERHWMQVDLQDGRQGYVPVSELIVSANDPSRYP